MYTRPFSLFGAGSGYETNARVAGIGEIFVQRKISYMYALANKLTANIALQHPPSSPTFVAVLLPAPLSDFDWDSDLVR